MTIFLINTVVYMLFISFNLVPITDTALENENMFISYLLEFIFASLVIAPCEEILFRQFLQNVCQKYFGIIAGIFMQSVLYAVSFLGFYPLDIWYFILLPFLYALVWGIIKYRSKKLLPIILGHAIAG
jgi:membrane protease YdiL (CAAX protease family)